MRGWLTIGIAAVALGAAGCITEPTRDATPPAEVVNEAEAPIAEPEPAGPEPVAESPKTPVEDNSEHSFRWLRDDPGRDDRAAYPQPVLDGIVETLQLVPVLDEAGKPVIGNDGEQLFEQGTLLEVLFKDHKRPYQEGDRIEGTDFEIVKIWKGTVHKGHLRSGVELRRIRSLPPGYMPPAESEPK
jgi:hypothetical protein